jgi:DNA-directed RNA polymerase subunit M/transcription elongation factor TFIIS
MKRLEATAMPVKVRCPECEHVINAPDRARGKAVKCPECGKAVRVPEAKAAKAVKKVAAPPPSSSMLIANLDLDRLEDMQTRICPKCGAEVTLEDVECPECHVDLETGTLSAEKKAELSRKGPDPKLYYKEFVRDGIEFWKKEKRLTFRLTGSWIAFMTVFVGCLFMTLWAQKPLVRYFWMFIGAVCLLIPPGLAWNLHTTVIDATMRKKKKLGKYSFDKFLGAALGLKLIFWFFDIAAPVHLAALVFLVLGTRGMPLGFIVAGALEAAAVLFASLLFPVAMTHMSMPITTRGWLLNKLSKPFFRTLPAVLYWCFFLYLTLLPPLACVAAGTVFCGKSLNELVVASNENSDLYVGLAEIESIPKNKDIPKELQDFRNKKRIDLNWSTLILPSCLLVAAAGLFGMTAVFSMRTNGLYARYFMDRLDLETMAVEVTYVPKASNLRELEEKAALSWKPVGMGLGLGFSAGFLLGGSIGMTFLTGFVQGATYGMMLSGSVATLVGLCWFIALLFKDAKARRSSAKFATAVLVAGFVFAGIGAAIYSQSTFETGPTAPPENAGPGKGGAGKRAH